MLSLCKIIFTNPVQNTKHQIRQYDYIALRINKNYAIPLFLISVVICHNKNGKQKKNFCSCKFNAQLLVSVQLLITIFVLLLQRSC